MILLSFSAEVGKNVKDIKVGDRVGVGAQVGSCMNCYPCKTNDENYCVGDGKKGLVDTYNAKYADGSVAQGGYSTAIRAHQQVSPSQILCSRQEFRAERLPPQIFFASSSSPSQRSSRALMPLPCSAVA